MTLTFTFQNRFETYHEVSFCMRFYYEKFCFLNMFKHLLIQRFLRSLLDIGANRHLNRASQTGIGTGTDKPRTFESRYRPATTGPRLVPVQAGQGQQMPIWVARCRLAPVPTGAGAEERSQETVYGVFTNFLNFCQKTQLNYLKKTRILQPNFFIVKSQLRGNGIVFLESHDIDSLMTFCEVWITAMVTLTN